MNISVITYSSNFNFNFFNFKFMLIVCKICLNISIIFFLLVFFSHTPHSIKKLFSADNNYDYLNSTS